MAFVARNSITNKQLFTKICRNFSSFKYQKFNSSNLSSRTHLFTFTKPTRFQFSSQNELEPPKNSEEKQKSKRRIGILGVTGISITAIAVAFLFAPIFDKQRRSIIEPLIPELLNYAETSRKMLIKQASLRLLAYISQQESGALQIQSLGGIKIIIQLSTSENEDFVKQLASEILLNISKFGSLHEKLYENGISNWILHNVQQMHAGKYSSRKVINNIASIAFYVCERDEKFAMKLVKKIPFAEWSFLVMNANENFQINKILAKVVSKLSNKEKIATRIINEQGLTFLQSLSASVEIAPLQLKLVVYTEIARTIATICMNHEYSHQVVNESGLEFLFEMRKYQANWEPLTEQITRCIANISASENNSLRLLEDGWMKHIEEILPSENRNVKLGGIVSLANAANNEAVSIYLANNAQIMEIFKTVANGEDIELGKHVARAIANASAHNQNEVVHEIFHKIGVDAINKLARNSDVTLGRHISRAFGNFSNHEEIAFHFVTPSSGLWEAIIKLSEIEDIEIERNLAKSVANLAVNAGTGLQSLPKVTKLLDNWIHSEDIFVRSEAVRARSSLASLALRGPKYAEGIYLLYPQDNQTIEFDVVFIHGVSGDAFGTWRTIDAPQESQDTEATLRDDFIVEPGFPELTTIQLPKEAPVISDRDLTVWPRDWLPKQFPKCRVISIGYDLYLSKWTADTLPLEQLSLEVLKKLKLAELGTRPIIFVTHSFGGLVTKQMLLYAYRSDSYKPILDSTAGVVFFATPHRGSEVADYVDVLGGAVAKVFRPNAVITELRPQSETLNYLNAQFPIIAPKVPTLSFGENDRTCFGSQYTCLQIVSDYSANPNFQGDNHHFEKLDLSHRMVCKLASEEDLQYKLLTAFIRNALNSFVHPEPKKKK